MQGKIWGISLSTFFVVLLLTGCRAAAPSVEQQSTPKEAPPVGQPRAQSGPPGASLGMDAAFWKTWGDGQAELTSYALRFPRYGSIRKGTAVAIFVTENFSNSQRVKTDATPEKSADAFPVMKLNLVEDFQTGIYDYNVMTSTFIALRPIDGRAEGSPAKISFSSQEWCGHVYQQLLFGQNAVSSSLHSYFEGEADAQTNLPSPRNGVTEDALLLWARGMAEPVLKPGETRSVPLLPSLKSARFQHRPLGWREARLSRREQPETVTVPAGTFAAEVFEAEIQGGPTRRIFVEKTSPRRVLQWQSTDGEFAVMVRSMRARYWEQNDLAGEAKLAELGLPVPQTP